MKKILLVLLILILATVGYLGTIKVPKDSFYIIDSKLRGKKIFSPQKWVFYPELLIPGLAKVESISKTLYFSKDVKIDLPYSKVLDYFQLFKIEITISGSFNWNQTNSYRLYSESLEDVKSSIISRLQNKIKQIVFSELKNPNFSEELLIQKANKELSSENMSINIQIGFFPNWKKYKNIASKLEDWSDKNLQDSIVKMAITNYKKALKFRREQEELQKSSELSIKIAKEISESKDKDLVLKVMNSLIKRRNYEKDLAEVKGKPTP